MKLSGVNDRSHKGGDVAESAEDRGRRTREGGEGDKNDNRPSIC